MDAYQDSICLTLEKVLHDETMDPVDLPFWFLKSITKDFSENQLIGRGGFGAVYKGKLRNGMVVAVKKLHNNAEILDENFQSEIHCLIDVKNKNIVRFLGYCSEMQQLLISHEGKHILADVQQRLFCFEYLGKGSLAKHLTEASSGLQWGVRYQIIKGICKGVGYLHQQRIIHMDLKPQNILLEDSMVPKITDFGISRRLSENQTKTITRSIVGSLGYLAPEFIKMGTITFKTDIYSLGVIIIEILMGCKERPSVDKVLESWANNFGTSENHPIVDQVKACAEIGINCMDDDPENRPTIVDIISRLDETDISNSSVRSVSCTPSVEQVVDEVKSMNVSSALSQHEYKFWGLVDQRYQLAKKACKQMQVSASKASEDTNMEEAKQAGELIGKWEMIDVADALKLLSPDSESDEEAKQAVELIGKWEMIDVADALKLLSADFDSDEVRSYAVSVLERADDEELQCYLLQLVHALRFERTDKSRLALFLVKRALSNIEIASFLRWYIQVELHSSAYARRYYVTYDMLENSMMKLVGREDGDEDGFRLWQSLTQQTYLTTQLCSIMKDVRNVHGSALKKIEKLRQLLLGVFSELTNFDEPIRSPLAPTLLLTGVMPQKSSIFKSALNPLGLTFKTANGGTSKIIYKKGDDLRQDQLVIQTVSLMDRLLKLENLDLHLTPYRVLATGQDEGMVEFIPSSSLAQILSEHRSITSYLQKFHPDEDGPFGITAQCLETFIKSCAGYSVITYILGVGDRHLDNLLLTDDGRLFHVDFAYILGRDPKPSPPPMKLCKEMVAAMGGAESQYFTRFKSYCCEAYNILRKSSSLILNLFKLMERSGIPDISADESGGLKLQEKFRLDLDDEEAIHFFQDLINESISAPFPKMVEAIHRWAQYWR